MKAKLKKFKNWGLLLSLCCPHSFAYGQQAFNINFDAVRQSVVFLYFKNPAGELQEAGTGFLLGIAKKSDPQMIYEFLVTARHIANPKWSDCEVKEGQ